MRAVLEVVSPGAMASIQDLGRHGLRRVGVPTAGALEPGWLRLANALAGNEQDAPAIEFLGGGLSLRALEHPVRIALAGYFRAEVVAAGGRRRLDSWRSVTLAPGETLRCTHLTAGRVAYLALAGMRVPPQLGSASTYARAGLGGVDGGLLLAGVRFLAGGCSGDEKGLPAPPLADPAPIRVVLGPQDDYFEPASIACLLSAAYQVSPAADRMGMRLDGPLLRHRREKGVEITSDATVPGSIQVPAQGQPIVLLADGQTAGGYAKIATVISADLPRLGVMAPGQVLHFRSVSVAVAEQAARQREAAVQALLAAIAPLVERSGVDLQAIYAANLVSGVVDAQAMDDAFALADPPGKEEQ